MKEVEIKGDLLHSIEWLQLNGKRYFQAALYAGANVLVNQTKANLSSVLPKAANHNPKFIDTMMDAPRFSHTEGDVITVHVLGSRQSGSGTYRTRFFEDGTQDRYQKTFKGIPLKKKRWLGKLPALKFFSSAITSSQSQVNQAMIPIIERLMTNAQKQIA